MSDLNICADEDQNDHGSFSMNPLEMSEIMEVVVIYSPVETLKTARLVCDLWRKEATPHLFKRGFLTVPQNFHFLAQIERDWIISHMKIFLEFESNRTGVGIHLPNVQLLQRPDLEIFDEINPKIIGPLVKKFVFGVHNEFKMLERLLLWRLKGLRLLDTRPLSLVKKKRPPDFHYELMEICGKRANFLSSGNPKRPQNLPLTLVDLTIFVDCGGEPHSVERLCWLTRISNSIFITMLSFGFNAFPDHPDLPDSCCPDVRERISGVLSRLLEQSKDILTSLRLWGCEMYLAETIVPILPKLQFLELSINPPRRTVPPKYALPLHFQFSVNTPNLNEMKISYSVSEPQSTLAEEDKYIPNFLAGYFDEQKPAVFLKTLSYCDHGCDFELDPLLKCFSKLETLSYKKCVDFRKGACSIFTWGKELKRLRLTLVLEGLSSKISSFDSILTGFSQRAVDKIKNASTSAGGNLKDVLGESGDFNIKSIRIQPSILDLPKLERIEFKMSGNSEKYLPKKIFAVAGEYVFKLRPKLKVEFYVGRCQPLQRAKDALKDVAQWPNVEILQDS